MIIYLELQMEILFVSVVTLILLLIVYAGIMALHYRYVQKRSSRTIDRGSGDSWSTPEQPECMEETEIEHYALEVRKEQQLYRNLTRNKNNYRKLHGMPMRRKWRENR